MVLVFVLPTESGERLGYSLTIFLSFTVVLTITSDLMPTTSKEIPTIGKRYEAFADPEGNRGFWSPSQFPLEITKLNDFLAILVRIPWKISKLPSQHLMLGQYRRSSETPFKWRFAGGPMMARYFWILSSLIKNKPLSKMSWTQQKIVKVESKPFLQNFLDPHMWRRSYTSANFIELLYWYGWVEHVKNYNLGAWLYHL